MFRCFFSLCFPVVVQGFFLPQRWIRMSFLPKDAGAGCSSFFFFPFSRGVMCARDLLLFFPSPPLFRSSGIFFFFFSFLRDEVGDSSLTPSSLRGRGAGFPSPGQGQQGADRGRAFPPPLIPFGRGAARVVTLFFFSFFPLACRRRPVGRSRVLSVFLFLSAGGSRSEDFVFLPFFDGSRGQGGSPSPEEGPPPLHFPLWCRSGVWSQAKGCSWRFPLSLSFFFTRRRAARRASFFLFLLYGDGGRMSFLFPSFFLTRMSRNQLLPFLFSTREGHFTFPLPPPFRRRGLFFPPIPPSCGRVNPVTRFPSLRQEDLIRKDQSFAFSPPFPRGVHERKDDVFFPFLLAGKMGSVKFGYLSFLSPL